MSTLEFSRAFLDRSFDVVGRHVHFFGVGYRFAEPRITFGVAAADARRDGDFLDQFREHASALRINGAFFVFDTVPLGMAGHNYSFKCANFRLSLAHRKPAHFAPFCGYFFLVGGCFSRGSRAGALLSELGCLSVEEPSTASPKVNLTSASNFL